MRALPLILLALTLTAKASTEPRNPACTHILSFLSLGNEVASAPAFFRTDDAILRFEEGGWVHVQKSDGSQQISAQWEPIQLSATESHWIRPNFDDVVARRPIPVNFHIKKVLGGFLHGNKIYLVTNNGVSSLEPVKRTRLKDFFRRFWTGRNTGDATEEQIWFSCNHYVYTGHAQSEYRKPSAFEVEAFNVRKLNNGNAILYIAQAGSHYVHTYAVTDLGLQRTGIVQDLKHYQEIEEQFRSALVMPGVDLGQGPYRQ